MKLPARLVETALTLAVKPVLGPPVPIAVQRLYQDSVSRLAGRRRGVTTTRLVMGDRPALRLEPPGAAPDRAVLWLHGGAFVTGSFATHGPFAAALARAAGCRVYLLDYRRAPEHKHPAAVDDALAALAAVPESRVVLGGDSAGGCLALLAGRGSPRALSGLALISPVVDATRRTSREFGGHDPFLQRAWVEGGTKAYFGDAAPDLLQSDLSGLPPAVVHVSDRERLRSEGEQLAALLGAELVVLDGLWHVAHLLGDTVEPAGEAVRRLGASVASFLA